ncbi:uncharacterized protein LOC102504147 [Camelus ferus]|uniref:Uncharacterized protein LOC102504147 n=1 Tax=Camelus ferus TaxID=419612 RepID=A0A8B8SBC5_CAMFR|nr:uncharacterized protein LOC102504147 [Camelus ferus]
MEPRRQAVVTTAAPENAHLSWRQEAGLRSAQHPKRGGACDNQCGSSNINITLSETSQDFFQNIEGSIFTASLHNKWLSVLDERNAEEKITATRRFLWYSSSLRTASSSGEKTPLPSGKHAATPDKVTTGQPLESTRMTVAVIFKSPQGQYEAKCPTTTGLHTCLSTILEVPEEQKWP